MLKALLLALSLSTFVVGMESTNQSDPLSISKESQIYRGMNRQEFEKLRMKGYEIFYNPAIKLLANDPQRFGSVKLPQECWDEIVTETQRETEVHWVKKKGVSIVDALNSFLALEAAYDSIKARIIARAFSAINLWGQEIIENYVKALESIGSCVSFWGSDNEEHSIVSLGQIIVKCMAGESWEGPLGPGEEGYFQNFLSWGILTANHEDGGRRRGDNCIGSTDGKVFSYENWATPAEDAEDECSLNEEASSKWPPEVGELIYAQVDAYREVACKISDENWWTEAFGEIEEILGPIVNYKEPKGIGIKTRYEVLKDFLQKQKLGLLEDGRCRLYQNSKNMLKLGNPRVGESVHSPSSILFLPSPDNLKGLISSYLELQKSYRELGILGKHHLDLDRMLKILESLPEKIKELEKKAEERKIEKERFLEFAKKESLHDLKNKFFNFGSARRLFDLFMSGERMVDDSGYVVMFPEYKKYFQIISKEMGNDENFRTLLQKKYEEYKNPPKTLEEKKSNTKEMGSNLKGARSQDSTNFQSQSKNNNSAYQEIVDAISLSQFYAKHLAGQALKKNEITQKEYNDLMEIINTLPS